MIRHADNVIGDAGGDGADPGWVGALGDERNDKVRRVRGNLILHVGGYGGFEGINHGGERRGVDQRGGVGDDIGFDLGDDRLHSGDQGGGDRSFEVGEIGADGRVGEDARCEAV